MKVESIAECSLGAFCNTFDLHYVVIGHLFWSGLLRQVLLYTIKFNGYPIWEVKKIIPTERLIPVNQGRVRGNKNIFKFAWSYPYHYYRIQVLEWWILAVF